MYFMGNMRGVEGVLRSTAVLCRIGRFWRTCTDMRLNLTRLRLCKRFVRKRSWNFT
jgi:hypothetical protein